MLVSSADLLGTAAIAASLASDAISAARDDTKTNVHSSMRYAEAKLVEALTELRAARWGVERRAPQFDDADLAILLDREALALRTARDLIPASQY